MLLLAIALAAALSYVLNALAARGVGIGALVDVPNERSLHTQPVPRVGGIGVVAGLCASLVATDGFGLVIGLAVALAGLSLIDDWHHLPATARLAGHLAAAAAFCVVTVDAGPLVQIGLVVAMGWMTNLYNFMDGADGLAGGMAAIGFGMYAIAASIAGDAGLAVLCACIVAASLAFLRFNFHPAKIFMGDVGSIPLGFLAAALGVLGAQRGAWPWWFAPVVFAPFVADASVTLLRRLMRGEKVWQAHRSHYYQRLVLMGWGHRRTALAEYGVMAATGAAAVVALDAPALVQACILASLGAIYAGIALRIDRRWSAYGRAREAHVP